MKTKLLSTLLLCLLFTGCASVKHQVAVDYTPVTVEGNTVAISFEAPARPKMTTPGADCLLCLAAAAAANSGLTAHTKTTLKANDYNTKMLTTPVNVKKLKKLKDAIADTDPVRDHRPLKQTLAATHLLVIDIDYFGFIRNYSSYFPTSAPYSVVSGKAYLVNLETNQYDWYLPIYEKNSVGNDWKEKSSNYPGLTNAYYQSVASARDKILTTFQTEQN